MRWPPARYKERPCPRCAGRGKEINGEYLRFHRENNLKVGVREIARQLGLSASYISDLELNRRRVTEDVAKAYGLDGRRNQVKPRRSQK